MKGKTRANSLPDDLWLRIFETGITESNFGCSDLSSLSISCKHFNALSKEDTLWSSLLSLQFPPTPTPPPPPHTHSSFLRSVYKCRLEKDLQRVRASILDDIADVEHQLNLFARRIDMIQRRIVVRNDPIREFAAEIIKVGNRSPIGYQEHFKALYHRVTLINEQLQEFSESLLDMIMFREYCGKRSAIICEAPLPFAASSCSVSSQSDADIVLLETKADALVSEQKKYLEYLVLEQSKIEALLIREKENTERLAPLTSRLACLGSHRS